ncbi:MAG: DUF1292 domain-containing protein [Lachnospiraceae bacterium]|nr:DUF1292 domain-containing protein [Lachnospiraceae bacterium]
MADEFQEYVTFTVTNKDGEEIEMAVVDEFEFEKKSYVVGALIEGDTINEDGLYIYRAKETEDGFEAEKITNAIDYEKVVKAYMEMDGEE